jgi:hypothetical protein
MSVPELKYPQWQGPLAAATDEHDPRELLHKLQSAEGIINRRIQEVLSRPDDDELGALCHGLLLIQCLKKECSAP